MGKIDKGIIYGKLYNSESRTFLIRTGEKFLDETGPSTSIYFGKNLTFKFLDSHFHKLRKGGFWVTVIHIFDHFGNDFGIGLRNKFVT